MDERIGKNVAFLLHMYQPPWQYSDVLHKIARECYIWLTKWLSEAKDFKATININYSLTELLKSNGLEDIIENIGRGLENGSIELTGSAAYHPILPLLQDDEVKRQIELNDKKHREIFGDLWKPRGFFPPEMAFSSELAGIVNGMGYEWIATEDVVYDPCEHPKIPADFVASIDDMPVFFRSSIWSNTFSKRNPDEGKRNAEQFIRQLNEGMGENTYVILAFDAETICHHQYYTEGTMQWLAKTMKEVSMGSAYISELLNRYPERKDLPLDGRLYKGSWSTEPKHIAAGIYYPLWADPDNIIHTIQWELIQYAIEVVKKSGDDPNYQNARDLLDRGENSCQMWWASPENMARADYKPKYILDGSKFLLDSISSLNHVSGQDKSKAEQLYQQLRNKVYEIDAQIKKNSS